MLYNYLCGTHLCGTAVRYADRPSLIFAKKAYSFREIRERRLARGLQRFGVRVYDSVPEILGNSLKWSSRSRQSLVQCRVRVSGPLRPKLTSSFSCSARLGHLNDVDYAVEEFVKDHSAPRTGTIIVAFRHGRRSGGGAENLTSRLRPSRWPPASGLRPLMPSLGRSVAAEVRPCR